MELFVAIIWYLNLMAPNTQYTVTEVQAVVNSNPEVVQIANDVEKSTEIWTEFQSDWEIEVEADIIEWWEEDTSCSYPLETIPLPHYTPTPQDNTPAEEDKDKEQEDNKSEESQSEKEKK